MGIRSTISGARKTVKNIRSTRKSNKASRKNVQKLGDAKARKIYGMTKKKERDLAGGMFSSEHTHFKKARKALTRSYGRKFGTTKKKAISIK